ncbi:MAG TPA: SDR family oxidoreductase, partial [Phytomonospora sp.]
MLLKEKNAVMVHAIQNVLLVDMSLDFITATAAARRMAARGSGVIILLSSSAAKESRHELGGFNLACASIEALTRSLAGEVGRKGVRV